MNTVLLFHFIENFDGVQEQIFLVTQATGIFNFQFLANNAGRQKWYTRSGILPTGLHKYLQM